MAISIKSRYNAKTHLPIESILRGFRYLHLYRIKTPESFKHVKLAEDWFYNDVNIDNLESEMKVIRDSKIVQEINMKATEEEQRPS